MNSQTHAVSGWPERPEEPVAYLQVTDFVRMLRRRTDVVGPTCPSCHTVNRGRVPPCRACGESMPSRIDERIEDPPAPDASDKAGFPEARALRSVLRLTLGPSLVLFVAFASWYAFRTESRTRYEPSASTMSIRAASVMPHAAPPPKGDPLRVAVVDAGAISLDVKTQPRLEEPQTKNDDEPVVRPSTATTFSPQKSANRPRAARLEPDPLAACRSRTFLARAVCVNARCAEPRASRFGECREALRQRRIDEARRNPTLLG